MYIYFALTSVIEHSCQQIEMTSGIYIYIHTYSLLHRPNRHSPCLVLLSRLDVYLLLVYGKHSFWTEQD